jgi:hypothetical protein
MSALHYGGETLGISSPICGRSPKWVGMTTSWESVTCKWCLKKRPTQETALALTAQDSCDHEWVPFSNKDAPEQIDRCAKCQLEKRTQTPVACGIDVGFNMRCRRARNHEGFHTWDPKTLLGEEPV